MNWGARAAGALLILLGGAVMLGWWMRLPALVRILPEFAPMVFNAALSFVLAGIALAIPAGRSDRYRGISRIAGALLLFFSILVLAEHYLRVNLMVDWPSLHSWLPDSNPKAGRTSVATTTAFAMGAAALILLSLPSAGRWRVAVRVLTLGVGAIGAMGIVGYLVQARLLFPQYFFAGMAAHTAVGLLVFAAGLRSAWRQLEWGRAPLFAREDDQVTFAGAMILAAIALAAGLASFALLQSRIQTVVADNVLASLGRRVEMIEDVVRLRDVNARIVATRPGLLRNLRLIRAGGDDGSNLANIEAVVANFLQQGYSAIAYQGSDGRIVATGGTFVRDPGLAVTLSVADRPELLWAADGFVLRHRLPLRDAAGDVGTVLVEQPMPVLTRLSQNPLSIGKTADMGLCVRRESTLHCFPQRLNSKVYYAPLVNSIGDLLPMARALRGETGVVITRDYRNENVVAAYGPVGGLGLGMVVKIDAAEIFLPIREQLERVLGLLVVLVGLGTILLRMQVKPIATKLFDSRRTVQEKNVELENANQAKDRFLASMSHELRTPLNAIIGFTGTLLMKLPGPLNADQEKQLNTVQSSARHLLWLINDLLDLAKIEAGKVELALEPTVVQEVVNEVAATLMPQAQAKGLRLEVAAPDDKLTMRTDRRVLSQIILNLANNAIKFTESGGVLIRLLSREKAVEIAVTDTGIGIRPERQQELFGAFSQVEASKRTRREGTGLGLHLSRKLAELLGGVITFESEHGKGSTFTLTLAES